MCKIIFLIILISNIFCVSVVGNLNCMVSTCQTYLINFLYLVLKPLAADACRLMVVACCWLRVACCLFPLQPTTIIHDTITSPAPSHPRFDDGRLVHVGYDRRLAWGLMSATIMWCQILLKENALHSAGMPPCVRVQARGESMIQKDADRRRWRATSCWNLLHQERSVLHACSRQLQAR